MVGSFIHGRWSTLGSLAPFGFAKSPGREFGNMDQEHDAGPHLSHAEVEHGADVDDEEEGADDRQGEHWKS